MIEKLAHNIFCIKIPLPETPLKSLNSVIIKGKSRNLIIDTGLNHDACLKAMNKGLTELDIDRNRTDFLITHLHADHFGLLHRLTTPESRIYFNRPEAELVESWEGWEPMLRSAKCWIGIPVIRGYQHKIMCSETGVQSAHCFYWHVSFFCS